MMKRKIKGEPQKSFNYNVFIGEGRDGEVFCVGYQRQNDSRMKGLTDERADEQTDRIQGIFFGFFLAPPTLTASGLVNIIKV